AGFGLRAGRPWRLIVAVFSSRSHVSKHKAKTPSAKTDTKSPAKTDDGGRAAFDALLPRLSKLPQSVVQAPNTDVQAAATFALGISQKIKVKAMRERFLSLPSAEFDHAHLDTLEPAAKAALFAQLKWSSAEATATQKKIPLDLAQRA